MAAMTTTDPKPVVTRRGLEILAAAAKRCAALETAARNAPERSPELEVLAQDAAKDLEAALGITQALGAAPTHAEHRLREVVDAFARWMKADRTTPNVAGRPRTAVTASINDMWTAVNEARETLGLEPMEPG